MALGPTSRTQRRDRSGLRLLAALAASFLFNAPAFLYALSADTLRALHDRARVRQVAVASLTEAEWDANRAIHASPRPAPHKAPQASPEPVPQPKPAPQAHAQAQSRPDLTVTPPPAPLPPAKNESPWAELKRALSARDRGAPPAPPPPEVRLPASEAPKPEPRPAPPSAKAEPRPAPRPPKPDAAAQHPPPPPKPAERERVAESAKPSPPPAPAILRTAEAEPSTAKSTSPSTSPQRRGAGAEPGKIFVEQAPNAGPEQEPDESKPVVLSNRNSRASENTVARAQALTAEPGRRAPRRDADASGTPAAGEGGEAARRAAGKAAGARGDAGPDGVAAGPERDAIAFLPEGERPRAGGGAGQGASGDAAARERILGARDPDLSLSTEAVARIATGATFTIVGGEVEEGERTALNARAATSPGARYGIRQLDRANPVWDRMAKELVPDVQPFLDRPRSAGFLVTLDRRGRLAGVRMVKSTGVEALDARILEKAREMIWQLVPFPPPPEEYASTGFTFGFELTWEPQGRSRAD